MAAKKGKTTKKAGTKGKKAQNSYSFRDEIIILLTLAVAILLILSNFGLGGFLGNAVSAFLFGIFGLPAYIMPVLLFLGTAFVFSNRGNSFAYIKLGAGVGFSFMLCTFLQLLTVPFERADYYFLLQICSEGEKGRRTARRDFYKIVVSGSWSRRNLCDSDYFNDHLSCADHGKVLFKRAEKGQCRSSRGAWNFSCKGAAGKEQSVCVKGKYGW